MLGFQHNMAFIPNQPHKLTKEEFKEMDDLRKAISQSPSSVHPNQQERFTELFVRSLPYVDAENR